MFHKTCELKNLDKIQNSKFPCVRCEPTSLASDVSERFSVFRADEKLVPLFYDLVSRKQKSVSPNLIHIRAMSRQMTKKKLLQSVVQCRTDHSQVSDTGSRPPPVTKDADLICVTLYDSRATFFLSTRRINFCFQLKCGCHFAFPLFLLSSLTRRCDETKARSVAVFVVCIQ